MTNRVKKLVNSLIFDYDIVGPKNLERKLHTKYKLKISNPLMVFGVSDINRKFFPVAFMITSHETKLDYSHFFHSIISICSTLNLKLEPEFMMIDASRAIAWAIRKCFPRCKIVMCYFHLCYNVIILVNEIANCIE